MKHKISAVLFSFVLLLGSFTSVFSASAYALAPAESITYCEFCKELYGCLKDVGQLILDNFGSDEAIYIGKSDLEFRFRILNEFKSLAPSITSKISKNSLKHLISNWSIQDYLAIENEFGQETSSFCNTVSSSFLDYYHAVMFYFGDLDDFVDSLYNANLSDYSLDDKGNVQIPIEDFKAELEKQNNTIDPKNRSMLKYSWRDLSNNQDNVDWSCFARNIVDGCNTCVGSSLMEDGMYIQVYMRRNGYMYYTPYQYHMYADVENIFNEDNIVTASKYNVYLDPIYYQTVNGESLDTFQYKAFTWDNFYDNANSGHIYFSLGFNVQNGTSVQGIRLYTYDSLGNCVKNLNTTHCYWFSELCETGSTSSSGLSTSIYRQNWNYFLRSDDVNNKIDIRTGIKHFFNDKVYGINFTIFPIYTHDNGVRPPGDSHAGASLDNCVICDEGNTCDFGFLISSEQFTTTYQFDTTRLPSNSTVTISGDSVYDYSITDNSTGESSTIYNYVTNNYNYPENSGDNTSGGNGGGTVGGNITVGGNVDVGGKVDINVNLNGNGDNYSMPDTSGMNDYLESALDDSSGFRKFLKEFFDFLPPPILILLGTALTCAIIARLCGR